VTEVWERAREALERGISAPKLEGLHLDFKTDKGDFKATAADVAEAAVCFANASGGTIILGVSDRASRDEAFPGTLVDAEDLRSKIHELTKPSLTVTVTVVSHAGATILVIDVPEGLEVYSTSKGAYSRRWADTCRPMTPTEVSRLNDERRGNDWSAGPSGHGCDEADPLAIEIMRDLLRSTGDEARITLASRPSRDLLSALELVRDDGMLNRAGALLTVRNRSFGPRELAVYQHRKSLSGEIDAARRWTEPVVITFSEILESITVRVTSSPLTLRNGQQIILEDFPAIAVREAIANALTHRDYVVEAPVSIIHSQDQLSVTSPGPLVNGVTPENFLSRGTKPRYPALARAFNRLGWVEYLGQGFNRIFRAMASTGRPLPTLLETPHDVTLVLSGKAPDLRVARLVADLPDRYREDTNALLILTRLCEKRTVTAPQLCATLQRDLSTTENVLRALTVSEVALLESTAGTKNRRNPNYRLQSHVLAQLGNAVSYYSHPGPTAERKIVDHLREYGSINSATVQRMLDVDVYAARDILRDLTTRNIIVRTSSQTRGTAVKYGPGTAFLWDGSRKAKRRKSQSDSADVEKVSGVIRGEVPLF